MKKYKIKDIIQLTNLTNSTARWLYDNIFYPERNKETLKHRIFTEENLQWIKDHQIGIFDKKYKLKLIPGCLYNYASPDGDIYMYKRGFFEKRKYEDLFGYYRVNLNEPNGPKTRRVHKLIALTFIPNPNDYPVINHINGNKHDNRVENLEWTTIQDNTQKAFDMGLAKNDKGAADSQSTPVDILDKDYNILYHFGSSLEAARELNINKATICSLGRSNERLSRKYQIRVRRCI